MRPEDLNDLSLLGQKAVPYIFEYQPEVLEAFPNRHPENDYFVKFNAPEFTSLCPITNQRTLRPFIFRTFLTKNSLSRNH